MYTFKKTYKRDIGYGALSKDASLIKVKTDSDSLSDIVQAFEDFLRGCGFCFKGHLDIVDDESENETSLAEDWTVEESTDSILFETEGE